MKTYLLRNLEVLAKVGFPVITGVCIGFFVANHAQQRMNQAQRTECASANYRRVVSIQTVVGTAEYCIPITYLANR